MTGKNLTVQILTKYLRAVEVSLKYDSGSKQGSFLQSYDIQVC